MADINTKAQIALGVSDGTVSIDGKVIAQHAGEARWIRPNKLIYQKKRSGGGDRWFLEIYDQRTQAKQEEDGQGANQLLASGGRWAAWHGADGLRTSWGLKLKKAGLVALGEDGSLAISLDRQTGKPVVILPPLGAPTDGIALPGLVYSMALLDVNRAVWNDYAGRIFARGLKTPQLAGFPHALVTLANGRVWLLQNVNNRLLLHPVGSTRGYVVATGHELFNPCMKVVNGWIHVGWSAGAGELPGDLRKAKFHPDMPRTDLQ